MSSSSSHDAALLKILKAHTDSGIGGDLRFVDTIFSFLRRNTKLLATQQAAAKVQEIAIKHMELAKKDKTTDTNASNKAETSATQSASNVSTASASSSSSAPTSSTSSSSSSLSSSSTSSSSSSSSSASSSSSSSSSASASKPKLPKDVATVDMEELESQQADEDENDKSPPPVGNGGATDKYTWTQTLSELTVIVPLKAFGDIRSKAIKVAFEPTSLSITINGAVYCSGALHSKISSDEATWTLSDDRDAGRILTLFMPKADKMAWWKCVLKGDPEINTKKIQPENSKLDELDGETRKTVEKMMWEQRMKAAAQANTGSKPAGGMQMPFGMMGGMGGMGMGASGGSGDEGKKKEALQRFMEQHPEMDFSQAKINWG